MSTKLAIYCDCDSDSGMLTYTLMLLKALKIHSDIQTLVISSAPRSEIETTRLNKLKNAADEIKIVPRSSRAKKSAAEIARILVSENIDVYIPNYRYMPHLVLSFLPRNIKNIIIVHNDTAEIYSSIKFYRPVIDGVIFPSKRAFEKSSTTIPQSIRKICIPHYFSALGDALETDSAPLTLVYHGRLAHAQKRSLELINIAQQLDKSGIPFRLKLIGAGDALEDIKKRISDEALDNVELIGQVSREQLISHLRSAHIALSTSSYEGFGYSIAESLSLGIIPVVYENEVLQDLIQDGINGYIVPWGRADLVAEKICALHSDKQLMQKIRDAAIESVKPLISSERYANQMATFISELLAAPHGKAWPLLRPRGLSYDTFSSRTIAKIGRKLNFW